MLKRRNLLGSAIAALLITPAGALAAGTTVTVRVEGAKRTLLAPKLVHTHAGSITKGGAPTGSCPATTAAGALNVATHGHWKGMTFSGTPGILVTSILGETELFAHGSYWSVWADNKVAQQGICALKLHRGEQLLFAPVPAKGTVHPIAIRAPQRANLGRAFSLKVVYYTDAGRARPLAGARVTGASALSNRQGRVTVNATHLGKLRLTATRKGYIRSAPVTVPIS